MENVLSDNILNRIKHCLYENINFFRLRVLFLGSRIYCQNGVRIGKRNIIKAYKGGEIKLGKGFNTCRDVEILAISGAKIIFGDNTYVGHGTTIAAFEFICIGDNTLIADLVSIRDYDHGFARNRSPRECSFVKKPIIIGKNCWFGSKVTIVAGVTLGDNVVVGANSVVTKNFGSNVLIGGCPARIIRELL